MQYDEWINAIFTWNTSDTEWDEERNDQFFSLSSGNVLDLIAATFTMAGKDLRPFSDEQIALGLNSITNETEELLYKIYDVGAKTSQRLAVINGVYLLYRDCLALRCGNEPEAEAENPLDIYAYMFWDASALSIYGVLASNVEDKEALVDVILDVLENTLNIPNAMCQRAAIHGLGHSIFNVRTYSEGQSRTDWLQRIYEIIDGYCALSTTHTSLKKYARQARTGMVN